MCIETFVTEPPCDWCGYTKARIEEDEELCALCESTRRIVSKEEREEKVV